MKKKIKANYKFKIPSEISIVNYQNKYLVISPQTAKWIVLENKDQLEFFQLLRKYKLGDAQIKSTTDIKDIKATVVQLIAKDFENTKVKSCISNVTKQLHLYLTNGCNLRCPHCYMYSGIKHDEEISTKEIEHIIDNYVSIGGKSLTLSGGEITTRKDLCEIITYAYKAGLKVRLLTNGVLWSKDMVKFVSRMIDSVQVSIDGYSEESNSKIRGNGNFEKSLQTIDWFVKEKVNTEMAITPPFNSVIEDESELFVKFCKYMISKYSQDDFKIKIAEQLIEGRNVHLTQEEDTQYYRYITKIKSKINGGESDIQSGIHSFGGNVIMDNCMYGVFSIDSTGNVYFCSRVSSLKPIGNIRTMSFNQIAKLSKEAQELSRIDNFKPCNTCELRYICGGGCRIDYFPEFSQITNLKKVDFNKISQRKCTENIKQRFYRLMVECNDKMYI